MCSLIYLEKGEDPHNMILGFAPITDVGLAQLSQRTGPVNIKWL